VLGIGLPELLLLLVIGLFVLDPEDVPEIARRVGGWIHALRRAGDEVRTGLERQIDLKEIAPPKTQEEATEFSRTHERERS